MPKFDDYGTTKGLAYQNDWQQATNNMLRFEQYKNQQQLQREKKAQYYADKIKRGGASTKYNTKRLEGYYNGLNKDLGQFLVENPNWEQDIELVSQFNEITDKYLNNDILKEDLDVQKNLELIRQDRHNMSDDHFNMLMEQYDQYGSQDIQDDLLAESQVKFGYTPEPFLNFGSVAAEFSKNNISIETKTKTVGDERITYTEVNPESLELGYIQMVADPKSKKSLDMAWQKYLSSGQSDYSTKREFGMAALRAPKNIGELRRENIERNGSGDGIEGGFTPYTANIVEELFDTYNEKGVGNATVSSEALSFTSIGDVGSLFNPKEIGAMFVEGKGNINKYSHANSLTGMRATNAYSMKYIPENGSYMMEIGVIMDLPSNDDVVADLESKGFLETDNYYSKFDGIEGLIGAPKKKGMYGKITVPCDPSVTNRYLDYEAKMGGKSLKQQVLTQQYADYFTSKFTSFADVIDNTFKANEELRNWKKQGAFPMNPAAEISKNVPEQKGNINAL